MTDECETCDLNPEATNHDCPLRSALYPEGQCEKVHATQHSPGTVDDDEMIIRTLYCPHHIEDDRKTIKPAAFDDAFTATGMSLNRSGHSSPEALWNFAAQKLQADIEAGKDKEPFIHFIGGQTRAIRSLEYDDSTRSFFVYDTAMSENIAHCDVSRIKSKRDGTTFGGKSLKMKIRSQLREAFNAEALSIQETVEQYFPQHSFDANEFVIESDDTDPD